MGTKKYAIILCIGMLLLSNIQADAKTNDTESDEIVTEETYVPVDEIKEGQLDNAAMGSGIKLFAARSSADHKWINDNGIKSFYDAEGTLMFGEGSKYVIDVSEHNGIIDWEKVKDDGVDGAIIRVGYGYLMEDAYFKRNVSECNRLEIPYGIYLYSYAYDANFAFAEANGTAEMLKEANVNLSYPIYYDIENFNPWNDEGVTRKPPETVSDYRKVIKTYLNRMNELGYDQVHVYSYRSYLQTKLNDPEILSHVSWVAAYTDTLGYENPYYKGEQGWQYTSGGTVDGIMGNVDLNCFSNQFVKPSVKEIVLSDRSRKMSEGTSYTMRAQVYPVHAANKTVSWRVGNHNIATVDKDGKVYAKSQGKTWLYASTSNGMESKCLIEVLPAATDVKINYTSKGIIKDNSYTFQATVYPNEASQAVTWRTGNSKVATVDKNGNVSAVGVGNTWLYAKTWNGKEAKCLIRVTNPATSISFPFASRKMSVQSRYQFQPIIKPSDTTSTLAWRIGNSNIATVDNNGTVSAKAVGKTWLYATTSNGLEAKVLIEVIPAATGVKINYTSKTIKKDSSYTFQATVYPSEASQAVTWRTGNSKVATVDKIGNVSAIGIGNTWLYAKTWNGKEAKCLIQVK